ncbi:transcriptional activator protein acu-15 [Sodiomyces alkalinus F11]|uniref:Transcriptional activator protein acu-15 n=1 Tax=Sodiomyces alkalinus (strain CBS 110278 / VKM F-3762 / F11) TaxID=1314773 RepID=A0A3N2PLU9_SODAK|nr:transcriptional activator protein acu-15 [Sodiomyces alkalinus F11]ROT35503.1 transcriptional activator protein acu-15 [Sodiomyces alkalinus F11]
MPGILPMKVIKVGSSSQSRIAQACDRCRSKKIRCDGIRPTCSQCANVGFECRTSDKLSRRAFPRGYTESLEERVRQLESEVHELKDLLDEKDEKIDMLSKMHGNGRRSAPSMGSPGSSPTSEPRKESLPPTKEDTFKVQASPLLLGVENSDSYFMGPSSGRSFIEAFKRRLQESGKTCSDFNAEAFLHIQGCPPLTQDAVRDTMRVPPRLFSDRCVNVYFQEWAPLFPVLHKPTFLRIYEDFVSDPEKIKSNHKVAQIYLVFAIATLSSSSPDVEQLASCERRWQRAIDAILMENTMATLQCLVLALMYCTARADYKRLQHYKGVAVGLSHRLGLHQSQKRFSFGALTIETRKKVFWTLYTLDCFSGSVLGLPKLLKEDDIHAEYPSDTDDEYVTEKGFQPTLPGEYTKLSSALALFRFSRILAKVLEKNYPAATSHELSLQQMSALEAELNGWLESLPAHLKLNFVQDKPSTDVTGSRSPLLALAYYFTRILIYRPAVGSSLGQKAAPALMSVSDSSKHIIQIVQLLEERGMSFSFCLNKADTLMLCGMSLLYQIVGLKKDSKMMKDAERLVNGVVKTVMTAKAPGCIDFALVSGKLIHLDEPSSLAAPPTTRDSPGANELPTLQRASPPVSPSNQNSPPAQDALRRLQGASSSESDLLRHQERLRRMTMPSTQQRPDLHRSRSRPSFDDLQPRDVTAARHDQRHSLSQAPTDRHHGTPPTPRQNLDYLSLSKPSGRSAPSSDRQARLRQQHIMSQTRHPLAQSYSSPQQPQKAAGVSPSEWEALLGSMDGGFNNVYDAIYGGPPLALNEGTPPSTNLNGWSPDSWDLTHFSIGDCNPGAAAPPSTLSEESLSSGDDLSVPSESNNNTGVSTLEYRNALLASCNNNDGFILNPPDNSYTM